MSIRTRCSSPVAGLRIGRPVAVEDAGDDHPRAASLDLDLEPDRLEHRRVHGARHRMKHPPVGGAFPRLSAMENGDQSLALRGVGALVDDRLHLAVALVNRTRPRVEQGDAQPVQCYVAEMPLLDPHDLEAAAVAVGRQGFELARTAVVAVAAAELDALDVPVDHGPGPSSRSRPRHGAASWYRPVQRS
jgi:hypothetical protein